MALTLTMQDVANRENAYEYLKASDELVQQGQFAEAPDLCRIAADLYDEEGATSYHCMTVESQSR